MPGNFQFDDEVDIFSYLSALDGRCLQATCLDLHSLAEAKGRIKIPLVESDLETALFYRLWGPYHGY